MLFRKGAYVVAGLLILASIVTLPSVSAGDPVPSWSAGDYWNLEDSTDTNKTGYKVVGSETKASYDCYRVDLVFTSGSLQITYKLWMRKSDLAIVALNFSFMGTSQETVFNPPQGGIGFPIEVGNTWTEGQMSYKVEVMEKVTVRAGSFDAYKVKSTNSSTQETGYSWYSPQAGYMIKSEGSSSSFGSLELVSYRYAKAPLIGGGGGLIPGLDMMTSLIVIVLIVVVVIAIALVAMKRKKKAQPSMPPAAPQYAPAPQYGQQPQYGQPPQYGQQPQYGQPPQNQGPPRRY